MRVRISIDVTSMYKVQFTHDNGRFTEVYVFQSKLNQLKPLLQLLNITSIIIDQSATHDKDYITRELK